MATTATRTVTGLWAPALLTRRCWAALPSRPPSTHLPRCPHAHWTRVHLACARTRGPLRVSAPDGSECHRCPRVALWCIVCGRDSGPGGRRRRARRRQHVQRRAWSAGAGRHRLRGAQRRGVQGAAGERHPALPGPAGRGRRRVSRSGQFFCVRRGRVRVCVCSCVRACVHSHPRELLWRRFHLQAFPRRCPPTPNPHLHVRLSTPFCLALTLPPPFSPRSNPVGLEVFDDKLSGGERRRIMAFGTLVEPPPPAFSPAKRVKAVMDATALACQHLSLCVRGRASVGGGGGGGAGAAGGDPGAGGGSADMLVGDSDGPVPVQDAHAVRAGGASPPCFSRFLLAVRLSLRGWVGVPAAMLPGFFSCAVWFCT
jgi:hypothetical protein